MNIGNNHTRVGVIQFSSWAAVEIALNKYVDAKSAAQAIREIHFHNSGTAIGEAIQHALDQSFVKSEGDRACSPDVLVVITDGKDNGNLGISGPVTEAQCRRIITIAVGVGNQVDDDELSAIAAGNQNRIFKVDTFTGLFSLKDHLCTAIEGKSRDYCNSNPCSIQGTCYNSGQNYTCVCTSGYTGRHCETEINECLSDPCENHGTCEDLVAAYNCLCENGYHGKNCQYEDCGGGYICCWLLLILGVLLLFLAILIIICLICRKKKYFTDKATQTRIFTPVVSNEPPVIIHEVALAVKEVQTSPVNSDPEIVEVQSTPVSDHLPIVDLLFIVDNSGSVGNSNFKKIKSFLAKIIRQVTFSTNPAGEIAVVGSFSQFCIILFNRETRIVIPFGEYSKKGSSRNCVTPILWYSQVGEHVRGRRPRICQ